MSKDDRIVVRMSKELRDWVHAQASAREMDDAAYVRMVLAEARSGVAATRIKVEAPLMVMPAQPVRRDVLDVVSDGRSHAQIAEDNARLAREFADAPSTDVDALVAASLAVAEEQGLTQPQIEAAQGEMPPSGVRALFRRPTPFSRNTAAPHLQSMLG